MILPKIYKNQHLVLGASYNAPSVNQFPNIDQIASETRILPEDVLQAAYLLNMNGLVHIQREKTPFIVVCSPEGAKAFLSRKLLEDGKEKGKANLLRWAQILGIAVASFISVATYINNLIKTNENTSRIKELEMKVYGQSEKDR
ncbi:hypothetical protein DNI29_05600 [Hymenobacter sediminis]|uniref:hypothetical protein n=1 Tax=Hymenobacter sediminis TaxID=2218621 RepID=UPI000F4FA323|nr:hypothetical protein [Hymenobacter sediminis]RPD50270.1 hypothetical protein DNI29_05600 [Hymenobacter sediminis]